MSFRDIESGQKGGGGHIANKSKQQPKQQRNDDDTSFERTLRGKIQEMQESNRTVSEHLDRAQKGHLSQRLSEGLDKALDRSRDLAQQMEQLFQDWTLHMAGQPSERHRKKFSYEKLQKAFEEELNHLKEDSRRAIAAKQEAHNAEKRLRAGGSGGGSSSAAEHYVMRDVNSDIEDDNDVAEEEEALLGAGGMPAAGRHEADGMGHSAMNSMMTRIADEREAGIRRIQNQVMEVNQMFRDLACIVTEQGAQFETIEQQALNSSANTKQAVKELKKAAERQRSQRERLCCMVVALIAVLAIVILPHVHFAGHVALTPSIDPSVETLEGTRIVTRIGQTVRMSSPPTSQAPPSPPS